jgi:hypothetical protein
MPKQKKVLYWTYAYYGTMFFSKDGYVDWFHENDANFRSEYMDFIPKFFGGEMKRVNVEIPDDIQDKLDNCDGPEDAYEILKPYLKI